MGDQNKSYILLYIVCGVVVIALIYAGINLINQSNESYNKSIYYTELALKDSALKTKTSFLLQIIQL